MSFWPLKASLEPNVKNQPGDAPSAPWEKPKPEEKAKAESVHRALNQAAAQVDSPEKANQVAKRLEKLAGSATTGEVEQARQPEKSGTVSDKVAESSRRIEPAAKSAPPGEKAANGIAQSAKEITATRLIRQQLPKVQVVALLSFKEQKMVQNALQAGVIGYLLKDVSADELAHAIRAAHPGAQPCLQRPPRHWSMLLPSRPCLART